MNFLRWICHCDSTTADITCAAVEVRFLPFFFFFISCIRKLTQIELFPSFASSAFCKAPCRKEKRKTTAAGI